MKTLKTAISLFIIAALAASCISAHAEGSGKEELKIGYINLGRTFDEYEKTQQYEQSLGGKGDKKEQEREALVADIKKLKDEMILLSAKGKKEKQENIDEKMTKLQEFDKETRDELRSERDNMVRDILREIDKVIRDFGEKNSFTVILNDRILVYGNEAIDITQDIIGILNGKKDQ